MGNTSYLPIMSQTHESIHVGSSFSLGKSVACDEENRIPENLTDEPPTRRQGYETIIKENTLFEEYYTSLGFLGDEEDRKRFFDTLKRPLPTTFRITETRRYVPTYYHLSSNVSIWKK
jgi:hypothetical protein